MEPMAGMDNRRAIAALLFIAASTNAMDVYSALNSSPWTAESFGGNPAKADACRGYVRHAIGVSTFYTVGAGIIGRSWWPVVGGALANVYMFWLYERALARADESGSQTWGD
ncbi:MAG TPA: hypothetical protein VN793_00535 [Acidimicrobiales bacterium]|nr:hypothetical protein [Acidimicrobiales bacterium]